MYMYINKYSVNPYLQVCSLKFGSWINREEMPPFSILCNSLVMCCPSLSLSCYHHRADRVLSFSPVVGIGTLPLPRPQASVLLLPTPSVQGGGGGVHSRLRERGWGAQFRRGDRHCCTPDICRSTLWLPTICNSFVLLLPYCNAFNNVWKCLSFCHFPCNTLFLLSCHFS